MDEPFIEQLDSFTKQKIFTVALKCANLVDDEG